MQVNTVETMEPFEGAVDHKPFFVRLGEADRGCKSAKKYYGYHGKCVDCPLPLCLEDHGAAPRPRLQDRRRRVHEMTSAGKGPAEIAEVIGVSSRTVLRDLALKE